jgi:uncharacterized protein (DUF433 family)
MKQELETALAALTNAEKAELPAIEKTPGVAGGAACLVRTRIPVWLLESYRRQGWAESKILASYPSLRAADLVHAWSYADAHRAEIEEAIRSNEAA